MRVCVNDEQVGICMSLPYVYECEMNVKLGERWYELKNAFSGRKTAMCNISWQT